MKILVVTETALLDAGLGGQLQYNNIFIISLHIVRTKKKINITRTIAVSDSYPHHCAL